MSWNIPGLQASRVAAGALWLILAGLFLTAIGAAQGEARDAGQIWFAPVDPIADYGERKGQSDFMRLFADPAAWPDSLATINVIQLYSQFIDQASDDQLRTVFAFLKAHEIGLAVETWVLHPGANGCGTGLEGYLPRPDLPARFAARIKALGGDLRYITVDESFGANRMPSGCRLPPGEAAKEAGKVFAIYRAQFPQVHLGNTENLPTGDDPAWFSQYQEWADGLRRDTGRPLAYFHWDVDWRQPAWAYSARRFKPVLARRGIPFGVIFNATPGMVSSAAWVDSAIGNIERYRKAALPEPEHAVFQSWDAYPQSALPEDAPPGHLYLIRYYLRRFR
jgi:hypothetical protein